MIKLNRFLILYPLSHKWGHTYKQGHKEESLQVGYMLLSLVLQRSLEIPIVLGSWDKDLYSIV